MPNLYKITAPNQSDCSYLQGTIHIGDPDITQLSFIAQQALENARQVLLEVADPTDAKAMTYWTILGMEVWKENNKDIARLTDDQLNIIIDLMADISGKKVSSEEKAQQLAIFRDFSPIFIITNMYYTFISGFSQGDAMDMRIYNKALELNIPVTGLEELTSHMRAVYAGDMNRQEQLDYVNSKFNINEMKDIPAAKEKMKQEMQLIINAYLNEDIESSHKIYQKLLQESANPKPIQKYYDIILTYRDLKMVDSMLEPLHKGNAFIAAGNAHLKGIIRRLSSFGYKVEPVTLRDELAAKLAVYISLIQERVLPSTSKKLKLHAANDLLQKLEEIQQKIKSTTSAADLNKFCKEINPAITKALTKIGLSDTTEIKESQPASSVGFFGKVKAKFHDKNALSIKVVLKKLKDDKQLEKFINQANKSVSQDEKKEEQVSLGLSKRQGRASEL